MKTETPPGSGQAAPQNVATKKQTIFSRNFLLALASTLAAFASFSMFLGVLPLYVLRVGGKDADIGMATATFALSAMIMRPVAGILADRWGRKPLIVLGALGMALAAFLFALATSIPLLLGARLLQGLAFGFFGTAMNALVADIAPPLRRGEAIGYYGMSNNLSLVAMPALAIFLFNSRGPWVVFPVSAAIAFVAFLVTLRLREPRARPAEANPHPPRRLAFFSRPALLPSFFILLFALTFGSIMTFVPVFATQEKIGEPGLFFSVFGIVVLALRGFSGQLSDRWGRGAVIIPGFVMAALTTGLLSLATNQVMFLLVAALTGACFAAIQPVIMALVVDRAKPQERGAAMGTFFAAMDIGMVIGPVTWGIVAGAVGYRHMYQLVTLVPVLAIVLFLLLLRRRRVRQLREQAKSLTELH